MSKSAVSQSNVSRETLSEQQFRQRKEEYYEFLLR